MGRKSSIIRAGSKFYANVRLSPDEKCEDECCNKYKEHEGMLGGVSLQAILDYINSDNINGLKSFLLNKHVQIDESDDDGWSALTYAVSEGKLEIVELLLQYGADISQKSSDDTSLLHHAAIEGHVPVAAKLLELGIEVDSRDSGSWTPLLWACYTNCLEMVSLLLQHRADPNAKGLYHCTGVVWAAGRGNLELVRLLIAHGARIDHGDKYGTTPLIWACRAGHASIVIELLSHGAQVDTVGMFSWTPLLMAVKGNHSTIVTSLLRYSPNVNAVDQDGMTALAIACKEGNSDIVSQLLSAGAYVNLQDKAGDTNLIIASKAGHKNIVDALIRKYADLDTKGKDNKTCLYWAVEKNHTSVVKALMSAGADIEIPNVEGNTPLLRAVKNRNLEIVQMLIDRRAKLSAADKAGDTALHIAMRARSKAIVGALLKNPKHSQLLYKPNRIGETPYNIDVSNQKTILSLLFGSRKLNTNLETENMFGYDLYGSVLADILTEPSLSMPITVGLYAKWGSGKSSLLSKLRDEMVNFARDWVDPTFHFSPVLFMLILHISTFLGILVWIFALLGGDNNLYGLISIPVLFLVFYTILFAIRKCTHKTDWLPVYGLNVFLAKRFNELKLLVKVVFCHPPGSDWLSRQEKAQPLKLFFTDQSKVSTSAGAENSVVQVIGGLYDALENTYGTFSTRLYRAFRPKPVKSTSAERLRKLCCIPYAALYCFSFAILVLEVIIVMVKIEVFNNNFQLSATEEGEMSMTRVLLVLSILLGVILGFIIISNIYTIGQVVNALVFSSRKHLQKSVAKHELVQSEGYLQAVKNEVNLLQQMVKTLDAFSGQQSRLIVIVDGLDSVEQRKILTVLDTVHNLFSNSGNPFIIILAIDPHVIIKAIELNLNQVFVDTSIGGNSYLRNMVHLPFFLQNSGLRKVKVAQQLAAKKNPHLWIQENEEMNRRLSVESDDVGMNRSIMRLKKKKHSNYSESRENSIGSNLHKISSGQSPMELNKMFLTDDYFSDVNPRSMRRLMNVIYVMGRLLKAFSIEFNWHHLSTWANITEQWPYRVSWITLYVESCEDKLDDSLSLKHIYDRLKPAIPTKEMEPLLCMDRDEKKLDAFLAYYRKTLTVSNMKIFLPFTINLDPYLKKVIKEEVQNMEDLGIKVFSSPEKQTGHQLTHKMTAAKQFSLSNNAPLTRRQAARLTSKLNPTQDTSTAGMLPVPGYTPQVPATAHLFPNMVPYPPWLQQHHQQHMFNQMPVSTGVRSHLQEKMKQSVPPHLEKSNLSELTVDQVCNLLECVDQIDSKMVEVYSSKIKENNICGRVLCYCEVDDLKNVLRMNFGDWELFKHLVMLMKQQEETAAAIMSEQNNKEQTSSQQNHTPVNSIQEQSNEDKKRYESGSSRKRLNSQERQVALEEATVTGLLSTLNEDAQEDILMEELQESNTSNRDYTSENDEADVLYYYNPSQSTQNIDILSDNGMQDVEKGYPGKKHREILWSAMSSRQGSTMNDLDKLGTCSPLASISTAASQLSSILEAGENIGNREKEVDKENLQKEEQDEDDPYAWLSKTAPPSPNYRQMTFTERGEESDSGYILPMFRRSTRREKRKKEFRESQSEDISESKEEMIRVSSHERMTKMKRRLHKAFESNELGGLPAVQRARSVSAQSHGNKEVEASRSPSPSPKSPLNERSSSQESITSSTEQLTVFQRPAQAQEPRPPLSDLFKNDKN